MRMNIILFYNSVMVSLVFHPTCVPEKSGYKSTRPKSTMTFMFEIM